MNIAATVNGISSRPTSGPSCEVLGPDMPSWMLRGFWRSYWNSGDRGFTMAEFFRLVRNGHVICCAALEPSGDRTDPWAVSADFGVELMADDKGPYTQFIFFNRDRTDPERGSLKTIGPAVIATCYEITRRYSDAENFHGTMRMYIAGRKGWRRMIAALGIEMHEGWITDKQKAFGHGTFRQSTIQL